MAKSVGKKVSNTFVWVLMALLVVGLMGFGTTQFSGGAQTVASVGDREVLVNDYARGLDQALNNLSRQVGTNITLSQAHQFGVSQQVMGQLLVSAALDNETDIIGVSAADARVARELQNIPAFQNISGQFDAAVYRSTLDRSGLTVSEFENRLRDEIARTVLQSAVAGGVEATDVATNVFLDYIATSRDFAYLTLGVADLSAPIATPDDAALRTYFSEVGDAYVVPETRQITYAWLTPAMLAQTIDVDEDVLMAAYEARGEEFNRPARRIVERLVFETQGDAEAGLARITSGETDFDGLVAERGLELSDIDLGDVTEAELGDAAQAVFAVTETGQTAIGPTLLGPAIFRINAILYPQVTPFEDVRDALNLEEGIVQARSLIADLTDNADDLLAGGATLEELGDETELELGTISFSSTTNEGIAGYAAFQSAARAASTDDFPEVVVLNDGGIFAMRLDAIDEQRPQTFDEAREALATAWVAAETRKSLEADAEALAESLRGGAVISDLGHAVLAETGVTRRFSPAGLPVAVFQAVLEMDAGDISVIGDGEMAHLVKMNAVNDPDITNEDIAADRLTVKNELAQGIAQDIFSLYTSALQTSSGISLNQHAINAVHAQFP